LLEGTGALPRGTVAFERGLALGQIAGGLFEMAAGAGGGVVGGLMSATGFGAAFGVPAIAVSAVVVTGGAANVAAGLAGLMSSGSGAGGSAQGPPAVEDGKTTASGTNAPARPSASPNFQDPSKAPSADWQWKGRGAPGTKGNWINPKTGEKLNPDLNHPPPIGPHYDYVDSRGREWRIFEDGRVLAK